MQSSQEGRQEPEGGALAGSNVGVLQWVVSAFPWASDVSELSGVQTLACCHVPDLISSHISCHSLMRLLGGRAHEIHEGDQESLRRLARGSLIQALESSALSGRP